MGPGISLAYLKGDSFNEYGGLMIAGILEAAREYDARVMVLSVPQNFDESKPNPGMDRIFELIRACQPTGVLVNGWIPESREPFTSDFVAKLGGLPVFFLGEGHLNYPHVRLHGPDYMQILLEHLVEFHGYSRVAFVPAYNLDDRDQIYIDYAHDHGIWEEDLYVPRRYLRAESPEKRAEEAVKLLCDGKGEIPRAIISMYTEEAVAILRSLERRGIKVPAQVALASWEDGEMGRGCNVPITAVEFPHYEMGRTGCRRFLRILHGESLPLEARVPTRIFYRDSCGCSYHQALSLGQRSRPRDSEAFARRYPALRLDLGLLANLATQGEEGKDGFYAAWECALRDSIARPLGYAALQDALSVLANMLLNAHGAEQAWYPCLDWAYRMLHDQKEGQERRTLIRTIRERQALSQAVAWIMSEQSLAGLFNSLPNCLSALGLESAWMFMEQGSESYELSFAYSQKQRQRGLELSREDSGLEPLVAKALEDGRKGPIMGRVAQVGENFMGFMLIDMADFECRTIEDFGAQLSMATQNALMRQSLIKAQRELQSLAEVDSLTGLRNRYSFFKDLDRLLAGGLGEHAGQIAIMFLDLDGFKAVNDSYGHSAGDALLTVQANRLSDRLGRLALGIYRLGGDEYTAIFPVESQDQTKEVAMSLREALAQTHIYEDAHLKVSASMGFTHFPQDGTTSAELLLKADTAMYLAKNATNDYVIYHEELDRSLLQRSRLSQQLAGALGRGEIEVHYQSVYDEDEKLVGFEALVRWRHSQYGLLLPQDFLNGFCSGHMRLAIEKFVLDRSCRDAARLCARLDRQVFVLVNCSNEFFHHPDFVDMVRQSTRGHALKAGVLKLGLEERFSYSDTEKAIRVVRELERLGVEFVLEGFGGNSSWMHFLQELPENTVIKVDRAFVKALSLSEDQRSLLNRLLLIFEDRGFRIVLSGVEKSDLKPGLRRKNCYYQGFAYTGVMDIDSLEESLKNRA